MFARTLPSLTLACALALAALSIPAPREAAAQTCTIADPGGARPRPRRDHGMAYLGNGKVLLFGGRDAQGNYLGDTWTYDGTTWTQVATSGPAPRARFGMANVAPGYVVIQGGVGAAGPDTSTWEFNGSTWTEMRPHGLTAGGVAPMVDNAGFALASMRYSWLDNCNDPGSRFCYPVYALQGHGPREFMGGGFGAWANTVMSGGGQWALDNAATGEANAQGQATRWAIAFGGQVNTGPYPGTWADVGGTTVVEFVESGSGPDHLEFAMPSQVGDPGARRDHAMAAEGVGSVILFGGSNADTRTWRATNYDRTSVEWNVASFVGPGSRQNHAMAYDPQRHKVVLFGGDWNNVTFGDTWEWDSAGSSWTQKQCSCPDPAWTQRVPATVPQARRNYAMAYDAGRGRVVLFGGITGGATPMGDTWEWTGGVWILRSSTGPSARFDAAMSYDPVRGRIVLFGGLAGGVRQQDTWEWDGASWTQRATTGPSARWGASMAYYPPRSRTTLYGGSPSNGVYVGDTWEWDGTTWALRDAGVYFGAPAALASTGLTFDPNANELVLFGGWTGTTYSGGLHRWNGTTWSLRTIAPAAARPTARSEAAFSYDPARGAVVLMGGRDASGFAGDTWEVNVTAGLFPWSPVTTLATPSARGSCAMAPDPNGEGLVLFGGWAGGASNDETWIYIGGNAPRVRSVSGPVTQCEGTAITLTVSAEGANLAYQWRRDGVPVPGATASSYHLDALAPADGGTYTAVVSNGCGSTTSPGVAVTVLPQPRFTRQPQDVVICPGGSTTFSAEAVGALSYQWYRNGVSLPGATSGAYTVTAAGGADEGLYHVEIHGTCDDIPSAYARLELRCPEDWWRVDAGGAGQPSTDEGPAWSVDTQGSPSPLVNAAATGNATGGVGYAIDTSDPSVPDGTPMALFQNERWDPPGGAELAWTFPVTPGVFEVTLYLCEDYDAINAPGQRLFRVLAEGLVVYPSVDIFAEVGRYKALVKRFTVEVRDASLDLAFEHIAQNPAVSAIEVRRRAGFRVRAGGSGLVASDAGPWWAADGAGAPSPYSNAIAAGNATGSTSATIDLTSPTVPSGTPMSLFQSERWDPPGGSEMSWSFPTGPGTYQVRLYLAEIYTAITAPGQRVFDVEMEGAVVMDDVDVFAEVGLHKALVKTATVEVADEHLDIRFLHGVENPAVKGIEIVPMSGFRVNAGGPARSGAGLAPDWSGDSGAAPSPFLASAGTATGSSVAAVNLTHPSIPPGTPAQLFQTHRWDPPGGAEMAWSFPTGPGYFTVRLYFAEVFSAITAPGQRVFDVLLEGQTVLDNLDIFAEVGANKGLVKTATVHVTDGALDVLFTHGVENPTVMAIEVLDPNGGLTDAPDPPAAERFALVRNAPNPFRGPTRIDFTLPRAGAVSLRVFDLAGRALATLARGERTAGFHSVTWDGNDAHGRPVAPGVYLCRLECGGVAETRRMVRLR